MRELVFIRAGSEKHKRMLHIAVAYLNRLTVKVCALSLFSVVNIIKVRVHNNAYDYFLILCKTNGNCAVLIALYKICCSVNRVNYKAVAVCKNVVALALLVKKTRRGYKLCEFLNEKILNHFIVFCNKIYRRALFLNAQIITGAFIDFTRSFNYFNNFFKHSISPYLL